MPLNEKCSYHPIEDIPSLSSMGGEFMSYSILRAVTWKITRTRSQIQYRLREYNPNNKILEAYLFYGNCLLIITWDHMKTWYRLSDIWSKIIHDYEQNSIIKDDAKKNKFAMHLGSSLSNWFPEVLEVFGCLVAAANSGCCSSPKYWGQPIQVFCT